MRALLLLILTATLFACPLVQLIAPAAPPPPTLSIATVAPSPVPPDANQPHVEISASATSLRVGESLTLTGIPVDIGLPYYMLTFSSGASVTVTYDNQVRSVLGTDAPFELVSATGAMYQVTFVLRALTPGTVDATLSATGEVKSPQGAFMWGYGTPAALTLTITE